MVGAAWGVGAGTSVHIVSKHPERVWARTAATNARRSSLKLTCAAPHAAILLIMRLSSTKQPSPRTDPVMSVRRHSRARPGYLRFSRLQMKERHFIPGPPQMRRTGACILPPASPHPSTLAKAPAHLRGVDLREGGAAAFAHR